MRLRLFFWRYTRPVLFLGVDGGQSGTAALIGNEAGRVLGRGSGGPCNHSAEKLARAVRESVAEACRAAGLEPDQVVFRAACFGLSSGPAGKYTLLSEIVRAETLTVTDDAVIALAGATGGEPGIINIAGTGSIAFGRNAAGATARAGGWGYIFGDEGSAFDIVRQALRAILRNEEGWGPETALRHTLPEAAGAGSANELLHLFYTPEWPRSRIARLAPLVDAQAMEGDGVAVRIMRNAAEQLVSLTASIRAQLWKAGEKVRVAHVGGVFQSAVVLEHYQMLLEGECGPTLYEPAYGALLEARRGAGF